MRRIRLAVAALHHKSCQVFLQAVVCFAQLYVIGLRLHFLIHFLPLRAVRGAVAVAHELRRGFRYRFYRFFAWLPARTGAPDGGPVRLAVQPARPAGLAPGAARLLNILAASLHRTVRAAIHRDFAQLSLNDPARR